MVFFGTMPSPVGELGVVTDGVAVTRVSWRSAPPAEAVGAPDALLDEALGQLTAYFEGRLRDFDLPVDFGTQTPSTLAVLTALYEQVGFGRVVTYGELAALSGTGVPARGIGAIMGANPVPIIVPCHRVLAGDGLGGYSGGAPGQGLETKRALLGLEGVLPTALF